MQYYICKLCGDMTTSEEIEKSIECGGLPYCYCQYMQLSWDSSCHDFEPIFLKYFEDWFEIPENIYQALQKEPNTVKRLWMLATVPPEELQITKESNQPCQSY